MSEHTSTPEPSKEEILSSLRLRRIVRENHGKAINHCAFFTERAQKGGIRAGNVLVTVGGDQVNFYDNAHCGDHLDIMSHFVVGGGVYFPDAPQPESGEPPELLTSTFLPHPTDALLAAAGTDATIHIISLTRSQEIAQLTGHTATITHLETHPTDDELLLSVGEDGTVRMWHVGARREVARWSVKARCATFHPNGLSFITASPRGVIRDWEIPDALLDLSADDAAVYPHETVETGLPVAQVVETFHGGCCIDDIRYVDSRVLSKGVNGKVAFWDPLAEEIIHIFQVKGSTGHNTCRLGISTDGTHFCVGTPAGSVAVYSLAAGTLVSVLAHPRSNKAVRACAFVEGDR
ncbi:WD40-repeat-containing domain protein [Fimicolochytrium jonesii]|uniref:WD40-repeat-containing domain protein n=1 Tax=Fimicolochytrium jonesii TaxID=1396493 RepID=UPI0022FDB210|nr:WD40-repeat-containing domain protein [Fimicolochytrium jonesii]KAI8821524.1 WD40-repeat-containing domain protein [Fimicolochytrium jonesii]